MILHWIFFFLLNGVVAYSSYCVAGWLNRRGESLALVVTAAAIVYFAQITATVLFLGAALQFLNLPAATALNLGVSTALVYLLRPYRPAFSAPARRWLAELGRERDYVLYAVVALFAVQLAVLLVKLSVLPPAIWDSFVYHLPPAVEWYQQGRIPLLLDSPVQRVNSQALGMSVLAYWFFAPLQDDMLVELPQFLWALLLVPIIYAVLRQAGVGRGWALKFALLTFFVPIVVMQSVTTQDHLALNVGTLAGLLFMARFLETRDHRQLFAAALAFGLVLGYKLSAPLHAAIALALFGYFAYVHQREIYVTPGGRRALAASLALGLAVMTALGGYWYIRNLALYGNVQGVAYSDVVVRSAGPAEGRGPEAGGAIVHEPDRQRLEQRSFTELFGHGKLWRNLERFFPRALDYQALYGADLAGMSGFGPQFAAFGLPGMALALAAPFLRRSRGRLINFYAWSALALLLAYFSFYYSLNNYRLFSFLPIAMIPVTAVFLQRSDYLSRGFGRWLVEAAVVLSILWTLVLLLPPQYTNLRELREFASLEAPYRISSRYTNWFAVHRPDMYRLIGRIPADQPIAVISERLQGLPGEVGDDAWSYTYYDRKWQRRIRHLPQARYLDCNRNYICTPKDELRALLAAERISLVSVCKVNLCLEIAADDFPELAPGLYYFAARDHER